MNALSPPPPRSSPRLWIVALLALTTSGLGACERTTRDTDIKIASVAEVKSLLDRQQRQGADGDVILLIDPRPTKYYEEARLPGARNLLLPAVDPKGKRDPSIERYRHIIVYGEDPAYPEARVMTKKLMQTNYKGVRLFAGGMKEWVARGYPLEGMGAPQPTPGESTPPPPAAEEPPVP